MSINETYASVKNVYKPITGYNLIREEINALPVAILSFFTLYMTMNLAMK